MRASGVRIDHVAGDRAYYRLSEERVVLPERSQFPSQDAYTHTALHELGHATGHPSRLNRPTLVDHGGFGSEAYAKEELRAEIAAMMTGEKLGVGHEPRHGTAYVGSWVKALENDPREIRAAAVDAQRISDWLMARERERAVTEEQPAPEPANREEGMAPAPEREAVPVRVGNAGERGEEAHSRAAAPQRDAGPRGTGGDRGGGCAGGREHGRGAGLRSDARPGRARHGDSGLRHGERHGDGGGRLHRHQRHAELRGGRGLEDGRGRGARRRSRRGRGNADPEAVARLGRPDRRRVGHRDDREHRPVAAGADDVVRPSGGGARGRARRGTLAGTARAGHPGPVRGPGVAAAHGARHGGRLLSRFGGVSGANPAGVRIHGPMGGVPAAAAGSLGAQGLAGGVVGMASAAGPMGGMAGPGDGLMNGRGLLEMGFGGGDVLTRSDFALNRETRGGVFSV